MVTETQNKNIKTFTLGKLWGWLNALIPRLHEQTDEKQKDAFTALIEAIKKEIRIRSEQGETVRELKDISDKRPEIGLLKEMEYKVGNDGGITKVRRYILKGVCKGPLPFVHSQNYMEEWGKDGTKKRFTKLRNVLWALRMRMGGSADLAREHYSEDIEWLDENKNTLITQDDD